MNSTRFIIIIAMALATYFTKGSLMFLKRRKKLPPLINKWLSYIPLAIMVSLIAPSFFIQEGQFICSWFNPYLWAGIFAAFTAYWKENMLLTMVVGIITLLIFKTIN
ncbi:MAG TPA: AzlD domain-containing protein [Clostridia bacterium]|jgi:branched-subunit amino acid transport protein|nr:AzlD domain-containing protein [Clostridia bacterium]